MKKIFTAIAAALIVILCVLVSWSIIVSFIRWIGSLNATQKPALLGALALLLVPVVTFFTTKALERRKTIDSITFARRVEIYEDLVKFLMRAMLNKNAARKSEKDHEEPAEFMIRITPELVTYASNPVIKKWGRFRIDLAKMSTPGNEKEVMLRVEDLLSAVRSDLGHHSWTIQDGDIARLFINDIDEILGIRKPTNR